MDEKVIKVRWFVIFLVRTSQRERERERKKRSRNMETKLCCVKCIYHFVYPRDGKKRIIMTTLTLNSAHQTLLLST